MFENDSLIEIAIELMEKKRKPHTTASIAKDVFEMKGLKTSENKELFAQFQIDFMLCGNFICCGEDKKGNKIWDLKNRQPHEMQDKEGVYIEDPYDDDEDVIKNELKGEFDYMNTTDNDFDTQDVGEDDENEEETDDKDDIEEELIMNDMYDDDKSKKTKVIDEDDDDSGEDDFDDH